LQQLENPTLAMIEMDSREEVERVELGLAHVGLGEADIRRLRAMLMMAMADGSLRAHWSEMDASRASVIILGADRVEQWPELARGNRIVAVLVGAADKVAPGTPTISWPIRAEALLDLLKQAENRFSQPASRGVSQPLIQLADLLRRTGDSAPRSDAWLVTGLTRASIYIAPQRRQFFCTESLRSMHRFDVRNQLEVALVPLADLPSAPEMPKPIVMLQWSVGLLTGAFGLLPWLKPSATLQLQRFPEFQILHHEPVHRRLAAVFSRPMAGVDAAAEMTRLDRNTVSGFVNAAALCGYLRTSDTAAAAPRPAARVGSSSRRSLVQILRRALGIETAHG
jgi:hypothetical protein